MTKIKKVMLIPQDMEESFLKFISQSTKQTGCGVAVNKSLSKGSSIKKSNEKCEQPKSQLKWKYMK